MRDAVAQAQHFPQEVDARHFRHVLRAIHQVAQREVGTEPELVREPRQAVFHGAEKRVVGTQVMTMKISPCGRQTRCSSSSRRAGRSTTETTYIATTLSKLASGNVISSAFISSSASTFASLRFSTRARALSSISVDTSMPVTRVCGG